MEQDEIQWRRRRREHRPGRAALSRACSILTGFHVAEHRDVPKLLEWVPHFHSLSPYRDMPLDLQATADWLRNMIHLPNCIIFMTDSGAIAGSLVRVPRINTTFLQEEFWHSPGAGMGFACFAGCCSGGAIRVQIKSAWCLLQTATKSPGFTSDLGCAQSKSDLWDKYSADFYHSGAH